MKQKDFDTLFDEVKNELEKHGIELIQENIDVNKLRCEWAKNNKDFGMLYAKKGNAILKLAERGDIDYILLDRHDTPIVSYDTNMCKNKLFEDAFKNFKSDADIKSAEDKGLLVAEKNNWFNFVYAADGENYSIADDYVVYSLDEFLNANHIIEIFNKYF